MKKSALILGCTGQDGSYLAELLVGKEYDVHGIVRRSSVVNTDRLNNVLDKITLHYGDLTDSGSLIRALDASHPDEVYNLAAQSHVAVSFDSPEYTLDTTATGTIRLLEALTFVKSTARYYQASSSEMFGKVQEVPQTETTSFYPRSPYGCAKVCSFWLTKNYREAYGLHASNGILFNHESPRRGESFVTRKITKAVARIKWGIQKQLVLGNLVAKRDWGHAKDYVEAMWLMLQQPEGDDYVIATGETHTVQEFVELAFSCVDLDWKQYVITDQKFFRPTEVDLLLGNPLKAKEKLGWEPKIKFRELVREMVNADVANEGRVVAW